MQKVISVINMKGGVGKTTLAVNIAYVLSRFHKKKVLLIDIDPQFNASQYLVPQKQLLEHFDTKLTSFEILVPKKEEKINLALAKKKAVAKKIKLSDYLFELTNYKEGCLHLIPSSLKLINFEPGRGTEYHLKSFIESHCNNYDYVFIDCPPTLSVLTLSAFLASQNYIIPIKPDYLSSLGLPLLERGLSEYEETFHHTMEPLGIVFTLVDNRTNLAFERIAEIRKSGRKCMTNRSSLSTKVAGSVRNGITSINDFYRLGTSSRYAAEFKNITQEILDQL